MNGRYQPPGNDLRDLMLKGAQALDSGLDWYSRLDIPRKVGYPVVAVIALLGLRSLGCSNAEAQVSGDGGSFSTAGFTPDERLDRPAKSPDVVDISNFHDIKNVLFLCSNRDQYRLVVSAFQTRNHGRGHQEDVSIQRVQSGRYCVGTYRGAPTSEDPHRPIKMYIVNAEGQSDQAISARLHSLHAPSEFRFVQYRGHTGDMIGLVERGSHFEAANCIRFLGGCEATEFIYDLHRSNKPVIAQAHIGEASRNNYWGLLILKALNSGVPDWGSLQDRILQDSRTAQDNLEVPGTDAYDKELTGK